MCADKNACGCYLPKHGIENRPVASALNRINPYEDTINSHELVTNFRAKIVVINRRLGVYPFRGEGSEQVREPVIFSCCVPPYLIITRVKNRDPSVAILCHRVSLSMNSMSCPNYVYRFIFSAFEASFDVKPMSNEVVTVEEKDTIGLYVTVAAPVHLRP